MIKDDIMARYDRINEHTPNGGDYSEIYYFDSKGNSVDETIADHCIIRECRYDGTLIKETWGSCIPNRNG